jgi:hypothetical protein
MRELLECHQKVKTSDATDGVVAFSLTLLGVLVTIRGIKSLIEYTGPADGFIGCLLLFMGAAMVIGAFLSPRHVKVRHKAKAALKAKIEALLKEFPQECQTWGGQSALAHHETMKALLNEGGPLHS